MGLDKSNKELKLRVYPAIDASIIDMPDSVNKIGDETETIHYLVLLKNSLITSLKIITTLVAKKDVGNIGKELHKLKGALSLVSLPQLQNTIENFTACTKGKANESIENFHQMLEFESNRFSEELKKLVSTLGDN